MKGKMNVVDLFAGAGGLSEGFRQAGNNILLGTDHDPDAMHTYRVNFPEAQVVLGDIREQGVREEVVSLGANADVVVGGPPCQAFSQVRNHSRIIDDPRNSLYKEFVAVVGQIDPPLFVMENVPGMDQMGVRSQVVEDLSMGGKYSVHSQVLDAVDFGVPQTRRRIVFIGMRSDLVGLPPTVEGSGVSRALALAPEEPRGRTYKVVSKAWSVKAAEYLERLRDPQDLTFTTASQAIGDMDVLSSGNRSDEVRLSSLPAPASAYQAAMRTSNSVLGNLAVPRMNADTTLRLAEIPPGGNQRDLPESLRARYLTGNKWGPSNGSDSLSRTHYSAYRRLHPEFWAWTLNTKADAVYHYSSPRALSVREFCRLQSFPDDFVVSVDPRPGKIVGRIPNGATHSRYRQIGNAVPPLMAKAIATELQRAIESDSGTASMAAS